MEFYDREKELEKLMKIAKFEANLIHFIFGPINSGKTALIQEFIKRLPRDYAVFYINLRGVYVSETKGFLEVLFEESDRGENVKEFVKSIIQDMPKSVFGIPVPKNMLTIFNEKKSKNVFRYLEELFFELKDNGRKPVLIMDELQKIKDVKINGPLIYELFNFFIRLTKETHLCHVFCLTSDSLFVEQIYSEAMLQGRARYMLVDDFDYETTVGFLKKYLGDDEINLVWNYFGGKPIYLVDAVQNREYLREYCEEMLELRWSQILDALYGLRKRDEKLFEDVIELFGEMSEKEVVVYGELTDGIIWSVKNNVLFVNPGKRIIKPQSRLDLLAIRRVLDGLGVP